MVAIIVQARMGSTRLPGKVLKPIAGRPMLSYQVERLRRVRLANAIVVATTTNLADVAIVEFCAAEGISCVRGSEGDVLSRYYDAARLISAEAIVRVTSDCPLICPELIDQMIGHFTDVTESFDYVSNMIKPSWPYGMAVEVFSAAALWEAHDKASAPDEREHVTPYIYWRPDKFRIKSVQMSPDLSHHRWTVDTPEDFELVSRILEVLYPKNPNFTLEDVLDLLSANPAWEYINRHVAQKTVAPTGGEN
jgi:spore coat polysaccharide biosynthesis protein SpsF